MAALIRFSVSLAFVAVPATPLLLLFWLMRPTVLPNPGMSAYKAPPATRLEPHSRKMDSLISDELSEQALLSDHARNYARPYFIQDDAQQRDIEKPAKRQVRVSDRKRLRLAHERKHGEPPSAYALDWNGDRRQSAW